jgi:hypothetical protein
MGYKNLVEDEKQARKERIWMRLAIMLIVVGGFFVWLKLKKE